ncbi:T-box transcription factor TBX6 [Hoplias malabaricus]|uniref:T-box transcription factor TBX6 n=1 Tax=Hoplias malabaricus TaxID=27720 RepID=UPI003462754C
MTQIPEISKIPDGDENPPQSTSDNAENNGLLHGSNQIMTLSSYATFTSPQMTSSSHPPMSLPQPPPLYSSVSSTRAPDLPLPTAHSNPSSLQDYSSIAPSHYSSSPIPSSTTSPTGATYASISHCSSTPQLPPSSTYHSVLPPQNNLSPTNPHFQSLPPSSCQSINSCSNSLSINTAQNQAADGGLVNTPSSVQEGTPTAFPFPPVQSSNSNDPATPPSQIMPQTAFPFSPVGQQNPVSGTEDQTAFSFHSVSQSTSNPVTTPSDPNTNSSAFPFPAQPTNPNPQSSLPVHTPAACSFTTTQPLSTSHLNPSPSFQNPTNTANEAFNLSASSSVNAIPLQTISIPAHAVSGPISTSVQPPHSLYAYPTSVPSAPHPLQNLAMPTIGSSHGVAAIPNMVQIQPAIPQTLPAPSFAHVPPQYANPSQIPSQPFAPVQASTASHLPHSALQTYGVPSGPTHAQYPASTNSYPPVAPTEIGSFSQINPSAPYLPDVVLHPSFPSSAPPSRFNPFPSYPLRLCQDPRASFHLPVRHIYRQPQHVHSNSQGSYLDLGGRPAF